MLNQFFIEREILNKVNGLLQIVNELKLEMSNKIREKSEVLQTPIPQELKKQLMSQQQILNDEKKFQCKYCCKYFNDGRKLGGHISRSHPFVRQSENVIKLQGSMKEQGYIQQFNSVNNEQQIEEEVSSQMVPKRKKETKQKFKSKGTQRKQRKAKKHFQNEDDPSNNQEGFEVLGYKHKKIGKQQNRNKIFRTYIKKQDSW